jgi:hypothetical protein
MFRKGEVLAARLREDEVARCEREQGITATDVPSPPNAPPLAPGFRRVAVVVVETGSLSDEEVEDLDAWGERYQARVRLATRAEAAGLVRERTAARSKKDAEERLLAARGPQEGYGWRGQGIRRLARKPSRSLARPPEIVTTSDGRLWYIQPVYDDSPLVWPLELSRDEAIELARAAGWEVEV